MGNTLKEYLNRMIDESEHLALLANVGFELRCLPDGYTVKVRDYTTIAYPDYRLAMQDAYNRLIKGE